jgi:hypothetical protein
VTPLEEAKRETGRAVSEIFHAIPILLLLVVLVVLSECGAAS